MNNALQAVLRGSLTARNIPLILLLAGVLLLVSCGGGDQDQQNDDQGGQQRNPKKARLSAVLTDPNRYAGRLIDVRGGRVAQVIEPRSFVIARRQALEETTLSADEISERGLLVIRIGDSEADVAEGENVRVRGLLQRNFDVARLEENRKGIELNDALYKAYAGEFYLTARHVGMPHREETTGGEETTQ